MLSERDRLKQKRDLEKAYVAEFQQQREIWKQKEKERLEEENATIARFASLQKDRENARQAAKKEQEQFRAGVQKDVSHSLFYSKQACAHFVFHKSKSYHYKIYAGFSL